MHPYGYTPAIKDHVSLPDRPPRRTVQVIVKVTHAELLRLNSGVKLAGHRHRAPWMRQVLLREAERLEADRAHAEAGTKSLGDTR